MKQIYNFEQAQPPVLNENMIRSEIEKRKLRTQTALLAIAGILLQVVMGMFGFLMLHSYPWITVGCVLYILISATGGSAIAIVFTRKGGWSL